MSFRCFFLLIILLILHPFWQTAVNAGEVEKLRIISTNDVHSYMRPAYYRYLDEMKPWGTQSREGDYVAKAAYEGKIGGMAHVATVIKRLRQETAGRNIVLDAGDTWHGAGISVFDRGVSMVNIMNNIGYDAMAPGNWEFIYERDHFLKLVDQAKFPVVVFNLTDKDWGDPVLPRYHIKQTENLKIAIIGMTYPWTALTSAISGAAKWWNYGIPENEARELIAEIREEENPDLVVVVSHGGYGLDQKFAQRVDGIDVLISGHTHDEIFDPIVWNDTLIYQGGALGKFVASLDLDIKEKKIVGYDYQLIKIRSDRIKADAEVSKLVEQAYQPHQEKLSEVVGQSNVMLYRRDYWQSPLGNLLSDVIRETAGADIGFFPAWRYGATILPGEITAEHVYNAVPTDGHIFTYKMTGTGIRFLLENILGGVAGTDPYARVGGDMIRFSGLTLRYDLTQAAGKRITQLLVSGEEIQAEKLYRVASAHTRFQNNPLFGASKVQDSGRIFVEELIRYIQTNSPINTTLDDRIMSQSMESGK